MQAHLTAIRGGRLSEAEEIDAELIEHALRAELLEIEFVQSHLKNPVLYLGKACRSDRPANEADLRLAGPAAQDRDRPD